MPNSNLFPLSFSQYSSFLSENKVITGTKETEMVKKVGQRIAKAAQMWLEHNGYKDYLKDYQWEYNLVQSDQVNAWCMPGGKIVVYTGILPITQTETGLAVVMGHEIAHALADHGARRMSVGTTQQLVGMLGNVALQNSKYLDEFNMAYNVGSQVGVTLPFSRAHETEADEIGIQIMAIAGYDPEEAPRLWERMDANSSGGTIELLSTHPSNASRLISKVWFLKQEPKLQNLVLERSNITKLLSYSESRFSINRQIP